MEVVGGLLFIIVGCGILYFISETSGSSKSHTDITAKSTVASPGIGCALLGITLYGLVSFGFVIFALIFLYGIVVLVFRHAFGIELPFGRFN
jgi:hypothetical protein